MGGGRGLAEQRVTFTSSDGVTLSGIYRKTKVTPKASIVLAHGIAVDKDWEGFYPGLSAELARHGFESLRFDFRGHGQSEGSPEEMTLTGEVQDLAAAVRFLARRHGPLHAIVGTSLGAGIAVLYAAHARRPPFALVLLSSVLDYRRTFLEPETDWGKEWFSPSALSTAYETSMLDLMGFPLGLDLLREFKTLEPAKVLRDLALPVLMVHSERDPYTPFDVAREAAKSRPGVKFVRVPGAGHYFEGYESRTFQEVSKWLRAQLPA